MLLQDAVLRDGSTRTARVWKCVAGQNILPTEQPDSAAMDTEEQVLRALGTLPGIVKLVAREGPLFLLKPGGGGM